MEKYLLIKENNFNKARDKIKKAKKENFKIIFNSLDDDLNRKILEKENIDILLLTQFERKDFQKQRNSGFNHVLAKIAKKNNVIIGINLDEIIDSKKYIKSEIIARVKQNIKLCNKNNLKMNFILINKKNKRDIYDLKSLGLVLGMPTKMIKELKLF